MEPSMQATNIIIADLPSCFAPDDAGATSSFVDLAAIPMHSDDSDKSISLLSAPCHHPSETGSKEVQNQVHDNSSKASISSSRRSLAPNFPWSSKLIDRDEQQTELVRAFERSRFKGSNDTIGNSDKTSTINQEHRLPEVTLVTGKSGTGKTSLMLAFKKHVEAEGGFFISGKFDQLQRSLGMPYHTFVHAFTDFVNQILKRDESDDKIKELRSRIEQALECDAKLLTDMIPALEEILSDARSGTANSVKGVEVQQRFKMVFRRFVRAISSPSVPVTLFLDDLQWSDSGSLDLLREIVLDHQPNGLFIVGACRDNEVSLTDELSVILRALEDKKVVLNEIRVANLNEVAVNQLIAEALSLPVEKCKALTSVAYENTEGNLFFLKQYLRSLGENNLLYFDENRNSWEWDSARIASNPRCFDVVQLVSKKVKQLDQQAQEVLKVASCLGAEFDEYLLHGVFGDIVDLSEILLGAQENELLFVDEQHGVVRFFHDKIQQACYSLIAVEDRAIFHLDIGRILWNNSSEEDSTLNVFLVIDQLNMGVEFINEEDEKRRMAVLCLRAGERASQSSAFQAAGKYVDLGISLLGRRHWRDEYDLSLALLSACSEIEYIQGNFDKMDLTIDEIFLHARSFQDKLRAYTVKVYGLGAKNQPDLAIQLGLEVVRKLGQPFSTKARTISIIRCFFQTKALLRRFDDESISNLPMMEDRDTLAAVQMLNIVHPYTFSCKPEFSPLITFRMIQLTINGGLSAMSCSAFAAYGMLLSGAFGNVEEGYRFGQLAITLLYRFKVQEWYPRCYVAVYGMINTWKHPMKDSLQPLKEAHHSGLSTGEVEFSFLAASLYCTLALYSAARPLPELVIEMENFRQLMIVCNQDQMLDFLLPNYQYVLNLQGLSSNPVVLTGEMLNQEQALQEMVKRNNHSAISAIHQNRAIIACYFGEPKLVLSALKDYRRLSSNIVAAFGKSYLHLVGCLAALALSRVESRRYYRRIARKDYKELSKVARYGKGTFENRIRLLKAEFSASDGNIESALEFYSQSIELAEKAGNVSEQALACELAGNMLNRAGRDAEARSYILKAHSLYDCWGAVGKVQQLETIWGKQVLKSRT